MFRILIIGDSFVGALGVDQTQNFSSLLEAHLNENAEQPVEVINGTSNALLWLEMARLLEDEVLPLV